MRTGVMFCLSCVMCARLAEAIEITGNQLVRSMKPDRGAATIGGMRAEQLGVRVVLEYLYSADGSLIFMGETAPADAMPELIIGRVERGSDKVVVLRRALARGVDNTLSVHVAAFHYPLRDAVHTRLVVVETLGSLGRGDEDTVTRLEIVGTMGSEAGRQLGSTQIGMADILPTPGGKWAFSRVSGARAGENPDIDYPGRRTAWRLALGRVSMDEQPDVLVWQRHLVSPRGGGGKVDLVLEKENWAALSSRVNAEGYEWIPEVAGMPSSTDILWGTLGVTEGW